MHSLASVQQQSTTAHMHKDSRSTHNTQNTHTSSGRQHKQHMVDQGSCLCACLYLSVRTHECVIHRCYMLLFDAALLWFVMWMLILLLLLLLCCACSVCVLVSSFGSQSSERACAASVLVAARQHHTAVVYPMSTHWNTHKRRTSQSVGGHQLCQQQYRVRNTREQQ